MGKKKVNDFSSAIAEAKAIKDMALENAKAQLLEAFTPKLQSMLSNQIRQEVEGEEEEIIDDMPVEQTDIDINDTDLEEIPEQEDIEITDDEEIVPEQEEINLDIDDEEIVPEQEEDINIEELPEQEEPTFNDDELAAIAEELEGEYMDDEESVEELPEQEEDEINFDDNDIVPEQEEMSDDQEIDFEVDDDEYDEYDDDDDDDDDDEEIMPEQEEEDINIEELPEQEEEDINIEELPEQEDMEIAIEDDEDDLDEAHGDTLTDVERSLDGSKALKFRVLTMENKKLKKKLTEAVKAINYMRNKMSEVNLLNAKLLYANKLFKAYNLNESNKAKIIETIDRAKNIRETKLVFLTLAESYKNLVNKPKPTALNKVNKMVEGLASKSTNGTKKILNENKIANRLQEIANIKTKNK